MFRTRSKIIVLNLENVEFSINVTCDHKRSSYGEFSEFYFNEERFRTSNGVLLERIIVLSLRSSHELIGR
jgi:hypothetical protein